MHVQGFAESNLQKLTRACGQLLKATPDHSAPLVELWMSTMVITIKILALMLLTIVVLALLFKN